MPRARPACSRPSTCSGRGRSFRTRRLEHLIRRGRERLIVFGEAEVSGRRVTLGVEGSAEGLRARLAGERVASLAELRLALPVQIIDPEVHRLIEEGPSRRRRFLDWGVFHVEPGSSVIGKNTSRSLRQRNAALRSGQPAGGVCLGWGADPVRGADDGCAGPLCRVVHARCGAGARRSSWAGAQLGLPHGVGAGCGSSARRCSRSWRQDQELGSTQVGPQRAELVIRARWRAGQRSDLPRPAEAAGRRAPDVPDQIIPRMTRSAADPVAR